MAGLTPQGAAEKYGKRPIDWLNQDGVREYITALADMLKCEPGSLLKTKRQQRRHLATSQTSSPFCPVAGCSFAIWCDMQIDSIVSSHAGLDDWRTARIEAASRFRGVCDMLNLSRQADGKHTASHHYSNEAMLMNQEKLDIYHRDIARVRFWAGELVALQGVVV